MRPNDDTATGQRRRSMTYAGGQTCGIQMSVTNSACGRSLLKGEQDPRAGQPVCLLHSSDSAKPVDTFCAQVRALFSDAVARSAVADFTDVVFPTFELPELPVDACFLGATFNCRVSTWLNLVRPLDFRATTFNDDFRLHHLSSLGNHSIDFSDAVFTGECALDSASLRGPVRFSRATFQGHCRINGSYEGGADFARACFRQGLEIGPGFLRGDFVFDNATFDSSASFQMLSPSQVAHFSFREAVFRVAVELPRNLATVDCSGARFAGPVKVSQRAQLRGAHFASEVDFKSVRFRSTVDFMGVSLGDSTDFSGTTFGAGALFDDAVFEEQASFVGATFAGPASFARTVFQRGADFSLSRFSGAARFGVASFGDSQKESDGSATSRPVGDFQGAMFDEPSRVDFSHVNSAAASGFLARFANCDISVAKFDNVRWFRSPSGRILLQDELDLLSTRAPRALSPEVVAIAYRRLTQNFDSNRAYDDAEDCFRSVMDLRRRFPQVGLSWLAVSAYWAVSDYGSSYVRALSWWLLLVLLLVPMLLALPVSSLQSIQAAGSAPVLESHAHSVFEARLAHVSLLWMDITRRLPAAAILSVQVATYQRTLFYAVASPFGQVILVIETLCASAIAGMFLLALRRRFRR